MGQFENKIGKKDVHPVQKAHNVEGAYAQLFKSIENPLPVSASRIENGPIVNDIGQVHKMYLPAGWMKGREKSGNGAMFYLEYHAPKNLDVKVTFNYRGHRTSDSAAHKFAELLKKPAHTMALADLETYKEIVGDKARSSDFMANGVKTQEIHGKTVLIVEGQYKISSVRARTMYVDCDKLKRGSVVQEIAYQAPHKEFDKHLMKVKKCFESTLWK